MSSGGGKGGKNTEQTDRDIPSWLKDPAVRNLQRAEDVQRIEYMPYRGAEIASFNDTQNLAMNNNLATAKAFGLLDASSTMKAEDMMPTPTTFDGGFKGYSSMPLYDQALAETRKEQPGAMAQYDALFGAQAMAQLNASRNADARRNSGGGITPRGGNPTGGNFTPNYDTSTWSQKQQDSHNAQINPNSTVNTLDASYGLTKDGLIGGNKGSGTDYKSIVAGMKSQDNYEKAAGIGKYKPVKTSSRFDSKGYTPMGK